MKSKAKLVRRCYNIPHAKDIYGEAQHFVVIASHQGYEVSIPVRSYVITDPFASNNKFVAHDPDGCCISLDELPDELKNRLAKEVL